MCILQSAPFAAICEARRQPPVACVLVTLPPVRPVGQLLESWVLVEQLLAVGRRAQSSVALALRCTGQGAASTAPCTMHSTGRGSAGWIRLLASRDEDDDDTSSGVCR
jgi:hypothetical protein